MQIGVLGGGGWGTALARLLDSNGHRVCMWTRQAHNVRELSDKRQNTKYLPDIPLPERLKFSSDLHESVENSDVVVIAVPSNAVRELAANLVDVMRTSPLIVITSKGLEQGSLKTMSNVVTEILPNRFAGKISVLSGPSFAIEVASNLPTAVTVAAHDPIVAKTIQNAFSTPTFRVYTSTDIVGVEIGSAVKNVIALAVGVSDGLGNGYNARAALITRGIAEMTRLATRMGADPQTLSGLAGIGDLVLTCTSDLSRNKTVGRRIGKGEPLQQIQSEMATTTEGVLNCGAIRNLATSLNVDMPIVNQTYELLFDGKSPAKAVVELLSRKTKAEFPAKAN